MSRSPISSYGGGGGGGGGGGVNITVEWFYFMQEKFCEIDVSGHISSLPHPLT